MTQAAQEGYFYHEVASEYGGVKQRWLVVVSEARRAKEQAQLEKKIDREHTQLTRVCRKQQRKRFNCEADAQQALTALQKQGRYHTITGAVVPQVSYARAGRPNADTPTVTTWYLETTITRDAAAIATYQQPLGKFLLATNALDAERLGP